MFKIYMLGCIPDSSFISLTFFVEFKFQYFINITIDRLNCVFILNWYFHVDPNNKKERANAVFMG